MASAVKEGRAGGDVYQGWRCRGNKYEGRMAGVGKE